jgi:intracellular sulfur oxidation DsrE/DsrF family protein
MRYLKLFLIFVACVSAARADEGAFTTGPIFTDYGPVADVATTMRIDPETKFRHSFDVSDPAPAGEPNPGLVSAARFINMHARAGVPDDNVMVVVVVHGKAVMEMADEQSASAELIATLIDQGVGIIVCGQSAAYYDVATDDLLPGVEMALSAMTAHALLQNSGFTLNPF